MLSKNGAVNYKILIRLLPSDRVIITNLQVFLLKEIRSFETRLLDYRRVTDHFNILNTL